MSSLGALFLAFLALIVWHRIQRHHKGDPPAKPELFGHPDQENLAKTEPTPAAIPVEKENTMSLLKKIEVLPGQFVRLLDPETKEVVAVFEGGVKLVEKELGLIEGTLEKNHAASIKVTTIVPTVESGAMAAGVTSATAPATAVTTGTAAAT